MDSILLRTTIATLVAFAGGALGVALGRVASRRLTLLVLLAAGGLLWVTLGDVLPEAKEHLTWLELGLAVLSGWGLFWAVSRAVHPICPACAGPALDTDTRERLHKDAILLMAALAVHSTVDGLAVAAGDAVGGRANLPVLLAVSLHKLPEGLALALLLLGAGYKRSAALGWTLAVESTTELGGLIGLATLQSVSPFWLSLVFAHVGGGFLYLVALTAGALARHPKIPSSLLDRLPRKLL